MSKFFSLTRNTAGVVVTLCLLGSMAVYYLFVYLPANENAVRARRFRCLQNMDVNIHHKLDNSASMVNSFLASYSFDSNGQPGSALENLKKEVEQFSKKNFTLSDFKDSKLPKDTDSSLVINSSPESPSITIVEKKRISDKNNGVVKEMDMGYTIEQFMKPLLATEVFDNYLIFCLQKNNTDKTKHYQVAYETFPSGTSYAIVDSLLQVKNGIVTSTMRSIKIGGMEYRMFLHPVDVSGQSTWILAGLEKETNYQKEKKQLPVSVVLLLLSVAICLVVLLPWIKLYHMGSKDKLGISDGIISVLVSMMMMSLLYFFVAKYCFQFSSQHDKMSSSSNTLAQSIGNSFRREISSAYCLLSQCDALSATTKNSSSADDEIFYGSMLKTLDTGIDARELFWVTKGGMIRHSWTRNNQVINGANVQERTYFKNIVDDHPNHGESAPFQVDQVFSWATGEFTTVVSRKSCATDASVAAIEFTAKSVDNVVLPDGYKFAIIDTSGEVLYHSNPAHNLNENLNSELISGNRLAACIATKSDDTFEGKYYGGRCKITVQPIRGLPYFTIIFEDSAYTDARDTQAYLFTSGMLLLLLGFLILQFVVVVVVSSKRSFFKTQFFETSWIGPKFNSHREYNYAIAINILVIILLCVLWHFCSLLEYIYLLLFSITFISLYLNFIFLNKYKSNPYLFRFKFYTLITLIAFTIVIFLFAGLTLEFWYKVVFFGYVILLLLLSKWLTRYLVKKMPTIAAFNNRLPFKWDYLKSFSLMVTTRLIITSGIPVIFFFIYSFNYEQHLDTRYRQLTFAHALIKKFGDSTSSSFPDSSKNLYYAPGIYLDNTFIHAIKRDTGLKFDSVSSEDVSTGKILNLFRIVKTNVELNSSYLGVSYSHNEASFNSLLPDHNTKGTYANTTVYPINKNQSIKLISGDINYPLSALLFRISLWLLGALLIFYYAIYKIIKKLFALDVPSKNIWGKIDKKLIYNNQLNNLLFILGSPGSGKLKYLQGILKDENGPKLKCKNGDPVIYDDKDPEKSNVFIADMILIPTDATTASPDWENCKKLAAENEGIVIINHFEYNIKDCRTSKIKLDFIETLMQKDICKVIIISTVHPLTFLDSFKNEGTTTPTGGIDSPIEESELERWQVLLGHFRIIVKGLEISSNKMINKTSAEEEAIEKKPLFECIQETIFGASGSEAGKNKKTEVWDELNKQVLCRLVLDEVRYSHYLDDIGKTIVGPRTDDTNPLLDEFTVKAADIGEISDSLAFKLQITSHYFYTYIWQSLTKEEKILLYDLAEEGLVNSYDEYNLSLLICKGLIVNTEGTLMLFNSGFKNFILTAIGSAELGKIKAEVEDNGNWGKLKSPLNIAVVAILAFLLISQQETYTQVITYVTVLCAGIPTVFRLLSMIGSGSAVK